MSLETWSQVSGIVASGVGVLGVIGLAVYAWDTRKLRMAAQQQLEAGITPCVLLVRDGFTTEAPFLLKNVGSGIALNILTRQSSSRGDRWREMSALGPGESRGTQMLERHLIDYGSVECKFESLSGTHYWTRSGFSERTQRLDLVHEFKRLSADRDSGPKNQDGA